MQTQSTCEIVAERVQELVCVREPYFALTDLNVSAAEITATVPVQQTLGREIGAITAAEAGRHLAILGSCALAALNPRKARHYYLATSARIRRAPFSEDADGLLIGTAQGSFESKRKASASCRLSDVHGNLLYVLDVHYSVLAEGAFERLFSGSRQETARSGRHNPYVKALSRTEAIFRGSTASTKLAPLDPEVCQGHFDHFPMLPVAIVMKGLSELAGELLAHVVRDPLVRYVVHAGDVTAHHFAKPPEQVLLEASYEGQAAPECHAFQCRASIVGGPLVGEMRLVLERDLRPLRGRDHHQQEDVRI